MYSSNFGVCMQETSDHTNFMKTVDEIKLAERESEKIIYDAKEKSDSLLRKAKEQVFKEKAKVAEEITTFKNEKLHEGSKDIDTEVQKLIKKAESDAQKIKEMKLDKNRTSTIVNDFLKTI